MCRRRLASDFGGVANRPPNSKENQCGGKSRRFIGKLDALIDESLLHTLKPTRHKGEIEKKEIAS